MFPIAKSSILVVSALFPIVNPLGGAPISFPHSLLLHHPAQAPSRNIAINSFLLLLGSYFIGTHILAFFEFRCP